MRTGELFPHRQARFGLTDGDLVKGSVIRSKGIAGCNKGHRVNVIEFALVPWTFHAIILVVFLFSGARGILAPLWIVPVVLLLVAGFFTFVRCRQGRHADAVLGLLSFTAMVPALIVGIASLSKNLGEYYRIGIGSSYLNVLPSESATSKNDATMLKFAVDATVDISRAYGYIDALSGYSTRYCVAPITSRASNLTNIEYFAAGSDCCNARGGFRCGESADEEARSAVVMAMSGEATHGYQKAVAGAEKAYGLVAGDEYMLITWMRNPQAYRKLLWKRSWILYVAFGGMYLAISTLVAASLMPLLNP